MMRIEVRGYGGGSLAALLSASFQPSHPQRLKGQEMERPGSGEGSGVSGAIVAQADACADAFNMPKVAMMFLAMDTFPHAAMWALWFQQAGGLLPSGLRRVRRVRVRGQLPRSCGRSPPCVDACGPDPRPPSAPPLANHFLSCGALAGLGRMCPQSAPVT